MFFLTRNVGDEIIIDEEVRITIVEVEDNRVRLGFTAPKETRIDRREVYERRKRPGPRAERRLT